MFLMPFVRSLVLAAWKVMTRSGEIREFRRQSTLAQTRAIQGGSGLSPQEDLRPASAEWNAGTDDFGRHPGLVAQQFNDPEGRFSMLVQKTQQILPADEAQTRSRRTFESWEVVLTCADDSTAAQPLLAILRFDTAMDFIGTTQAVISLLAASTTFSKTAQGAEWSG